VHPHGTWGVIGAAIAVGRLKSLAHPAMRELINVAATMGMATSRYTLLDGATVRNIYTGHSGFMGLMAVRLVEAGFTGEVDGLKSIYGSVLADGFDPEAVVAGLGRDWLIADGYFKLHSAGRGTHSAIDALEAALAKSPGGRIDTEKVERIEVRTYKVSASPAAMLSNKAVTNSFGAKFSIPFALATILHHGHSDVACFDDTAVANPKVQALAARVEVEEEPAYTAAYPREQICNVKLVLNDGMTFEGRCTVMKGEPGNPHKPEDLERKFFELGTPIWGEEVARRLFQGCMRLEDIPDFRAFAADLSL
ncbi:MAG: MmgE/PrpD family protein, partial [Betaproteobacteria bacterium]|nr:MmgE/PrpD family protein [Betaproteobacteria bacterium]